MFSQLCRALFPWWVLGLPVMGFLFIIGGIGWDHRFGHPPYFVWFICSLYLLAGFALMVGRRRSRPPRQ